MRDSPLRRGLRVRLAVWGLLVMVASPACWGCWNLGNQRISWGPEAFASLNEISWVRDMTWLLILSFIFHRRFPSPKKTMIFTMHIHFPCSFSTKSDSCHFCPRENCRSRRYVQVSAGGDHTLLLRSDGKALMIGDIWPLRVPWAES